MIQPMNDRNKVLLERTLKFSNDLIFLLKKLPKDMVNDVLFKQVIRSGTSVGANYREACEAESGKDFVHKIRICKKESRETGYWLEILISSNQKLEKELNALYKECNELLKIFSSISSKFK